MFLKKLVKTFPKYQKIIFIVCSTHTSSLLSDQYHTASILKIKRHLPGVDFNHLILRLCRDIFWSRKQLQDFLMDAIFAPSFFAVTTMRKVLHFRCHKLFMHLHTSSIPGISQFIMLPLYYQMYLKILGFCKDNKCNSCK